MKIDLKDLKLHNKEREHFYFEETGRDEFLEEVEGKFLKPVKVDLIVENAGEVLKAHCKIDTTLQLMCSRCLDEISYPIKTDFYVTIVDVLDESKFVDRDDIIFIDQDEVDIQPYIEGEIYAEIPLNPLCNEECKGLCPICGINRNLSECHCGQDNIDPRWEKLKNFEQGRRE